MWLDGSSISSFAKPNFSSGRTSNFELQILTSTKQLNHQRLSADGILIPHLRQALIGASITTSCPANTSPPSTLSGNYTPENSFAGLVGVPLNGTWQLLFSDNYADFNGIWYYGSTLKLTYIRLTVTALITLTTAI